ncbi:LysR family transcriptional regulator [Salinisphaera sp. SPP-AMP-43]|uniref:LysR family transcriptional regulator n=1 Tax=Salinisphaera sp. SPP-AMP-43 TaxID=3121288 RepID=UPI003C6DB8F8
MRIPRTSLEQWRVLQAVVDCGGFAQAASTLNRSQSAISYTVGRLQERVGVELLTMTGRKAYLTEAGRSLLAEAAPLIEDLLRIEERAQSLVGEQVEVRLHVDSIYPRARLFAALRAFTAAYPNIDLVLREDVHIDAPALDDTAFDLAILAAAPGRPDHRPLLDIEMLALARPDHVLHRRADAGLTPATLARHLGVSIVGDGAAAHTARLAPANGRAWQVNTLEAAVEAVASGLCWGWLPAHLAAPYLESGELTALRLVGSNQRPIPLALCYADEARAGPATHALAQQLLSA